MQFCGFCQELGEVSGLSSRTEVKSGILGLTLASAFLSLGSHVWVPGLQPDMKSKV